VNVYIFGVFLPIPIIIDDEEKKWVIKNKIYLSIKKYHSSLQKIKKKRFNSAWLGLE
jgi:hypothetical protein